jgi:hypothetical protein
MAQNELFIRDPAKIASARRRARALAYALIGPSAAVALVLLAHSGLVRIDWTEVSGARLVVQSLHDLAQRRVAVRARERRRPQD